VDPTINAGFRDRDTHAPSTVARFSGRARLPPSRAVTIRQPL